jgi:hypothetical protein
MPESSGFDKTERGLRVLGKGVESLWGSVEISAMTSRIACRQSAYPSTDNMRSLRSQPLTVRPEEA